MNMNSKNYNHINNDEKINPLSLDLHESAELETPEPTTTTTISLEPLEYQKNIDFGSLDTNFNPNLNTFDINLQKKIVIIFVFLIVI
jgi:hypothetical protein